MAKRKDISKYSRVVSRQEIRDNEYNLNIPRYVDSFDAPESWDIYASMFGGIPKKEIDELSEFWEAFPNLKKSLFVENSFEHTRIVEGNLKMIIDNHADVVSFREHYARVFKNFDELLYNRLIVGMETLNISKEENKLSDDIFERLSTVPLVDEYRAFQILDDEWTRIATDLEMIQTEGFRATKQVDPNMITRKKNGIDAEIQEGWCGRILPFDLVQEVLFHEQSNTLREKEERLEQIACEQQEIIDSLTEEEKEDLKDVLNDDATAFITGPLNKKVKELLNGRGKDDYSEETSEGKSISMKNLFDEEKELKRVIKSESAKLHSLTKKAIENLADEQIHTLLKMKWIEPILKGLHQLPKDIIGDLELRVCALADKYAVTFSDIEVEIAQSEKMLSSMIGQLTGSDVDMQGLDELRFLLGGE